MSELVTIMFCFLLIASIGVITMFDIFIYDHSLLSIIKANVFFQRGTSQWMLYLALALGFFYGLVIDYRTRKNKKANKSS
jgi:hypothetical protein